MKKKIALLSVKMMLARISNYAFMVAFLTVVAACAIISVQFTFGVLDANYEKEANRYGEQASIVYNLNDSQADALQTMRSVDVGFCYVYGQMVSDNVDQPIPYGFADDAYYQIGHVQLKSGRMPEYENEIVVEETLGKELGIYQPGDSVYIKTHKGIERQFKAVGIFYDYVNIWNTARYSKTGEMVVLPRIITPKQDGVAYALHALIKPLGAYPLAVASRIQEELEVADYAVNENLYYSDNSVEGSFTKGIMIAFMIISLGASLAIAISLTRLFNEKTRDQFVIMRLIGIQKRDFVGMITIQQGLSALAALVMGIVLGMLMTGVISMSVGEFILKLDRAMLSILVAVLMITAMVVLSIRKTVKTIFDTDGDIEVGRYHFISKKQPINIAVNAFRVNIKRSLPSILAIGVSMAALVVMTQFMAELSVRSEIDYAIIAQSSRRYSIVDGYRVLLNDGKGFPWSSLEEISNSESVDFVYARVYDTGFVIDAADVDDPYWSVFKGDYDKQLKDNTVRDFEIVVIGDEQYANLCVDTTPDGDSVLSGCLLYTPETNGLKQTHYSKGDYLTVSGLLKTGYEAYEYVVHPLQIQGVFNESYIYEAGPMTDVFDVPVIVITEECAERMLLLRGYNVINVILSKSVHDKSQIEKKLMELVKQFPNATYSSTDAIQERMIRLNRVISVLLVVLCVQVGGFSAISFCVMLWLNMRLNIRKYLIFRCLGMSDQEVLRSICLENGSYSICILAIGCFGVLGFLKCMGWSLSYLTSYIGEACVSVVGLTLLTLLISAFLYRSAMCALKEPTFMNIH